jgi:hypothetical protein
MRGIRKFDAGRFTVVVQFGKEASQNARLLRRKERDASRGSRTERLFRMTNCATPPLL